MTYTYKPNGKDPEPRKCAWKDCTNTFIPKAYNQLFCCYECRRKANNAAASFKARNPEYWTEYFKKQRELRKKFKPEPDKKHGHMCKCRICERRYFGYFDMCPECRTRKRNHHDTTGDALYFV